MPARIVIAVLGWLLLTAGPAVAQTDVQFTDWTDVSGNVAAGSLQGGTVVLSGTTVSIPPASTTDGSSPVFSGPSFTPALPASDALQFLGDVGASYTLQFLTPVRDPVLHIGSLASTLEFPAGTQITRVSGQTAFTVSGSTITGAVDGSGDANGTVRLSGTFTALTFSATPVFAPGSPDGIYLQVGAPSPTPAPPPSAPAPGASVLLSPARNVAPPRIAFTERRAGRGRYRCDPGTWEGVSSGFSYTWWKVGSRMVFDPKSGAIGPRTTKEAGGETFTLPPEDAGERFFCQVQARDRLGLTLSATSATTALSGRGVVQSELDGDVFLRAFGDVRIRGIDVFQVVQPNSGAFMFGFPDVNGDSPNFPLSCGGGTPTEYTYNCGAVLPPNPARTTYAGVPLDPGKPATAVVYVDMANEDAADDSQVVDVTLRARLGGRLLSGTVTASRRRLIISTTPWVTLGERGDPNSGVRLDLPASWLAQADVTGERLDLEAAVSLQAGAGAGGGLYVQCLGDRAAVCARNDTFRLDALEVARDLPEITMRSIALLTSGQTIGGGSGVTAAPEPVMAMAARLFPGGSRMTVLPYSGTVDIGVAATLDPSDPRCKSFAGAADAQRSCRQAYVNIALDAWWRTDAQGREGSDLLLAIHRYLNLDPDQTTTGNGRLEPGWYRGGTTLATPGAIPTITVNDGTMRRPLTAAAHELGHAFGMPHADNGACGATGSEAWPLDYTGRLQGVAWDNGPRLDAPLYDFMSYCADEANGWLSARNWNRAIDELRKVAADRRATRARIAGTAGGSFATGIVGAGGAQLVSATPADPDNAPAEPDPRSSLQVRALGANGAVLGTVGVKVDSLADSGGSVATFAAPVPAGTQTVELLSGGAVVDRLARSRPPTVRIVSPRARTHVRGRLDVRWQAADPDGDALQATVEYSANGTSGWRGIWAGASNGRATIAGRHLDASRSARVRVTVRDAFSRARAESGVIRADGALPVARIETPVAGTRLQAGVRTLLEGSGLDDRQRPLRGRSLTWFAGARRLGTGERVQADLPVGTVRLRLVVRDRLGRSSTATRTLRVTPVPVRIRTLDVPSSVGSAARTVTVAVATTGRAVLQAGGGRYALTSRTRTLRLRLPASPRTGAARIPVRITAPGQRDLRLILRVLRR